MKTVITIQCRDNSTRMYHKAVRPFYKGLSILEVIIKRFRNANMRNLFILTSKNSKKTLEQANNSGVKVYIGSEDDVHDRFFKFVSRYKPKGVIRVCADNPFISLELMKPILKLSKSNRYDYISYKNAMTRHEGLFCEYINSSTLRDMKTKTLTTYEKNHVTPHIYHNDYRLNLIPLPNIMDIIPIRLTVDTMEDFKLIRHLYRKIGESNWNYIYKYLFNKPDILIKMKCNIKRNKKYE